jgi:magnesium transporter
MYLSDVLGRPVVDTDGDRLGTVDDVVANPSAASPLPRVVAVKAQEWLIPYSVIADLNTSPIRVRVPGRELPPYAQIPADLCLKSGLLDRHVIDTRNARAVRVNDVELKDIEGEVCVASVDVGGAGLLRRLGLGRIAQGLLRRQPADTLPWETIELVAAPPMPPGERPPLSEAGEELPMGAKLADLHPADRAEILGDLAQPESRQILEALDAETAADTLEAVEPDLQAHLVEAMPDDQLLRILEKMAPDEAADLLAELSQDRRVALLDQMEPGAAQIARHLLTFPAGTAGSLMTTDFTALPLGLTAGQTLTRLREMAAEAETLYYVYVTDTDKHLAGVLALSDLVLAQPDAPMTEFMRRRVISVQVSDSQSDVAQTVTKYHLLAVPVVDAEQHLVGMITADDALRQLIPARWKKHRPERYA